MGSKTKGWTMTTTSMRLLVSLGVVAGALASTGDARGGDAPAFSDLPVGRFTTPPKTTIDSVSARESVPGIFVVSPQNAGNLPARQRYVTITTDARVAAAVRSGGMPETAPSACLTEMFQRAFSKDDEKGSEWDENLATEGQAFEKHADNVWSGVIAVHTERVVEQNGAVSLESVDAWVDPQTRGARLISKGSVPLKLVRTPAFGVKVYAGRDERPDGKRFVQFVVVRPSTTAIGKSDQMWAMRPDGDLVHSSGCGHQRMAIPVQGSGGDTATIVATVVLPKLDANGKEVKEPAAETPSTTTTTATAKPIPKVRPAFFGARTFGVAGSGTTGKESEIRSRVMHIQVSVSRTAREKEPLVSVSSSWGGREQVDRIIEPEASPL